MVTSTGYSGAGVGGWGFVKGGSLTKIADSALAFITYLTAATHTRVIHRLSGNHIIREDKLGKLPMQTR